MKTALKYAVIYVAISFAWSFVEYFAGLQSTRIALHPYFVTPFAIILTGVIYYLAIREERGGKGKFGFGSVFMWGLSLTFLIVILHAVPFYIFNTFVNPEFFREMARHAVETGAMDQNAAGEYFSFNSMLIRGTVYRVVMGLIASLVFAWAMRRS